MIKISIQIKFNYSFGFHSQKRSSFMLPYVILSIIGFIALLVIVAVIIVISIIYVTSESNKEAGSYMLIALLVLFPSIGKHMVLLFMKK